VITTWSAARTLVTFVGSDESGPADLCQHFAATRARAQRIHRAAALCSVATIVVILATPVS
jgi:hypothetical protein